jgi:hypothetical protein
MNQLTKILVFRQKDAVFTDRDLNDHVIGRAP